jgi:hypothetical protein
VEEQFGRKMKVPIFCETEGCPNSGKVVNWVTNIPVEDLDLFYEGYDGSEEADYCNICGELGVAEDPEPG